MKKPLILFVIFVLLLIVAKIAYNRYCETKPEGCKKENPEEREEFPVKGIDW